MDVQHLIGEVARRHNVLVDPGDPIFVTVTLNELLLAEHVRGVQAAMEQADRSAALAANRHIEATRRAAAQVLAEGARRVHDQVSASGSVLRNQLEELAREMLSEVRDSAAAAARHERQSRWAAVAAIAAAFLTLGMTAALWSRNF